MRSLPALGASHVGAMARSRPADLGQDRRLCPPAPSRPRGGAEARSHVARHTIPGPLSTTALLLYHEPCVDRKANASDVLRVIRYQPPNRVADFSWGQELDIEKVCPAVP